MATKSVKKKKHDKFHYHPASKAFVRTFMLPFKYYFDPQFYGLDELDVTRPALYVTNAVP